MIKNWLFARVLGYFYFNPFTFFTFDSNLMLDVCEHI